MNTVKVGDVGQLQGPFGHGTNLIDRILPTASASMYKLKFGISIDPYDFMLVPGLSFDFMGGDNVPKTIQIGQTGMYETDEPIYVSQLSFTTDTPPHVLLEYVVCD